MAGPGTSGRCRQLGYDQADITRGRILQAHFALRNVERLRDGLFDRAFAEPELDRLVQWRDASLEEVADFGNLVGVDTLQQVGEQRGQLLAAGRVLQFFEALGERGKAQHRLSMLCAQFAARQSVTMAAEMVSLADVMGAADRI